MIQVDFLYIHLIHFSLLLKFFVDSCFPIFLQQSSTVYAVLVGGGNKLQFYLMSSYINECIFLVDQNFPLLYIFFNILTLLPFPGFFCHKDLNVKQIILCSAEHCLSAGREDHQIRLKVPCGFHHSNQRIYFRFYQLALQLQIAYVNRIQMSEH